MLIRMSPKDQLSVCKLCDDYFKPFIYEGFASHTGKSEDHLPAMLLRDTADAAFTMCSGKRR